MCPQFADPMEKVSGVTVPRDAGIPAVRVRACPLVGRKPSRGKADPMMHGMMGDGAMGAMMWGMGASGLLAAIVLVLLAAALVKYLFLR